MVQILRDLGGKTRSFQNSEDLVTSDRLDLSDSVRVAEDNSDLRGGETLARELEDVVLDLVGRDLKPLGSGALVGKGRSG